MLFRFRESQQADLGIIDVGRTRRPRAITEVTSITTCEKWRGQVLKEISRKVSKIQEPSLSDFMIRDLNDEINKAMKEKWMWETQIRNLGGPNYMRGGGKVYDDEGREIPGAGKGYKLISLFMMGSQIANGYSGTSVARRSCLESKRCLSQRYLKVASTRVWKLERICES